ncbi:concanavalin A-like lectin/glucanase domain-containing protein [Leptodontidium sp. 2 PMI_412]|nr:concanavalin A-like lectin/glucanase domain-containing protein [Leptodontidium sp. 2 PMI_412]
MKLTRVALPFIFTSVAVTAPTKTLVTRSTEICDSWGSFVTGTFTIYQNLWGASSADSGSQCTTIDSEIDGSVSWSTNWSWTGGSSSVKSYNNVALTSTGVQLSTISSIPTTWKWSYTGTDIVADVSYDFFTSSSATGKNEFEIMVWLTALGGAGPISSTGSSVGTTTIAGTTFDLYTGPNGDTTVYSFVATEQATDFSGDLLDFFTYLETNEGFSSSQYITTLEAGTEPFTGTDAVFTVSAYSVSIQAGSDSSKSVASVSSNTPVTSPSSTPITATSTSEAAVVATPPSSAEAESYSPRISPVAFTSATPTISSTFVTSVTPIASHYAPLRALHLLHPPPSFPALRHLTLPARQMMKMLVLDCNAGWKLY